MFVQVIRAKVKDEPALWNAFDKWDAELRAGATGFLGSTGGVTKDGQLVMLARFESEAAARRNSDRPEQGLWFAEVEKALDGPPTFTESSDVDQFLDGGSNDAGFVQVMVGKGDREKGRQLMEKGQEMLRKERPDLLGGITVWQNGGRFTQVGYFTSEAEARKNEAKGPSEEARATMEEFGATMQFEEFLDLTKPRLA